MVQIDTDATITPRAVRLFVRGQLDLMAGSVFSRAMARATRLGRAVELDLEQVDFIDGCGLSMLMKATGRARHVGFELTIVNASRYVCRLIEVTGTADRLPPLVPQAKDMRARAEDGLAHKALTAVRSPAFRI